MNIMLILNTYILGIFSVPYGRYIDSALLIIFDALR
jgi:hypothetical protein